MILAIAGALFIGLCLGLLGSGGAILTVPVLVYLLDHGDKQAIAESAAIVCGIALSGAVHNAVRQHVRWQSVLFFAPPSMVGAFIGSTLSHPVPGRVLMGVLAGVMLLAAWMMVRGPDVEHVQPHPPRPRAAWKIMLDGFLVGLLIGFIGIGGGFLIVPALVILGGLPLRLAVGTTLTITALSSAVSFVKHSNDLAEAIPPIEVDWRTIGLFIGVGVLGRWIGHQLGSKVNHLALTRGFSYFLAAMAAFILVKEFAFAAAAR